MKRIAAILTSLVLVLDVYKRQACTSRNRASSRKTARKSRSITPTMQTTLASAWSTSTLSWWSASLCWITSCWVWNPAKREMCIRDREFAAEGTPMLLALLALGNLSFWLCDRALTAITPLYRQRIAPRLKKKF